MMYKRLCLFGLFTLMALAPAQTVRQAAAFDKFPAAPMDKGRGGDPPRPRPTPGPPDGGEND